MRFGLKMMLETSFPDCKVDEASRGEDVIAQMRENNYQLVLLDLIMPNTDTNNLLHFINTFHSDTKVLIVSMNEESLYGIRSV